MTSATAPTVLERFGAAYLRTFALVGTAFESQWQMGRTPLPKEDTTERAKGTTSDPTPTITMDGRRLALRATVIEAEKALEVAGLALQAAERRLARALEKWQV